MDITKKTEKEKEKICEHRARETTWNGTGGEKRLDQRKSVDLDSFEWPNTRIIGVPEEEWSGLKISEEIVGKKFRILWKRYTHRSKNVNMKETTPSYSVIALLQVSDRRDIFKAAREEKDGLCAEKRR